MLYPRRHFQWTRLIASVLLVLSFVSCSPPPEFSEPLIVGDDDTTNPHSNHTSDSENSLAEPPSSNTSNAPQVENTNEPPDPDINPEPTTRKPCRVSTYNSVEDPSSPPARSPDYWIIYAYEGDNTAILTNWTQEGSWNSRTTLKYATHGGVESNLTYNALNGDTNLNEYTYDEEHRLIEQRHYYNDEQNSKTRFYYLENGRTAKSEDYEADFTTVRSTTSYTYTALEGHWYRARLEQTMTHDSSHATQVGERDFDDRNRIRRMVFFSEGKAYLTIHMDYDELERYIASTTLDSDGNETYSSVTIYHGNSREISRVETHHSTGDIDATFYFYECD